MQAVIQACPLRCSWLPERFSLTDHNGVEGEDRLAIWYMLRVKIPKVSGSGKFLYQDKLHDLFLALRESKRKSSLVQAEDALDKNMAENPKKKKNPK